MALPASGPISLSNVDVELGQSPTALISLNDANVRGLFVVPSGSISLSHGYGKSSAWSATISSHQQNLNLRVWALNNGWNGSSAATITVAGGVYIWSSTTLDAGLTTGIFPGGLTIINNGYIIGMGGAGAGSQSTAQNGQAGGPAITLNTNVSIQNNSYIAGGGGGGGAFGSTSCAGGGGGAGGGAGGSGFNGTSVMAGGTGGAIGAAGDGSLAYTTGTGRGGEAGGGGGAANTTIKYGAGGGGGRILPGVGGAGGLGQAANGFAGGSANAAGVSNPRTSSAGDRGGAGGGGWGAAGGDYPFAASGTGLGGAGGKCVNLNGFTVTWLTNGNRYGLIN